jgi:predicted GIY-YIG superfamily endonuclease
LTATMQHKDDISSYILCWYGLISLANLTNIIKKHISPLLLYGIVKLWSVNMVPNTIEIIVKTVIIHRIADRNISTTTEYCDSANKSQKDVDLTWGSSLQYNKDTIQFESPLSLVNKRQKLTYVSHNEHDQMNSFQTL